MSFISKHMRTNAVIGNIPYETKVDILNKINNLYENHLLINKANLKKKNLENLHHLLMDNSQSFTELIHLETGKQMLQAEAEVKKSISHVMYYIKNYEKLNKAKAIKTPFNTSTLATRPLGVIYKISPFNFPLWTTVKMLAPNLCLGNTVLIRPAQTCPLVGKAMESLSKSIDFQTFDVTFSDPKDTEFIISNFKIKGVSFTGSVSSGKIINEISGKYLKKNCLELGGNDAFIACKDYDINKLIDYAIKGRLSNSGQVCCGSKRFFIHEDIYDAFIDGLMVKLDKIKEQSDEDRIYSYLSTDSNWKTVSSLIQQSYNYGDTVLYGDMSTIEKDPLIHPLIIKVKDQNSPLFQNEVFGPVFSVDTFKEINEVIDKANNSNLGLSGSIFTNKKDISTQIADNLNVGMVFVNSIPTSYSEIPWGGINDSGYGRDGYIHGFEYFSNQKTIAIN